MAFWEADSRHAGELSVFVFAKKSIPPFGTEGKKLKKSSNRLPKGGLLFSVRKFKNF